MTDNKLHTLESTKKLIEEGRLLVIAGADTLLAQLPKGQWIGGSNPYLLDADGGKQTNELLYIKDFTLLAVSSKFAIYDENSISQVTKDGFDNGIILTIMPAFTPVHLTFGLHAPEFENQYINPLMGWVSGTDFDKVGVVPATTYAGGERFTDKAVTLHLQLPDNKIGRIEIINIYEADESSDQIVFEEDGFAHTDCLVNGQKQNLYDYMESGNRWLSPLITDYSGASINIGLIRNDAAKQAMFAAPVFKDTVYRLAQKSAENYQKAFFEQLSKDADKEIVYSYSCLYNYLNFGLEGKPIKGFTGVFTYGEVGYQLLNITFVYLLIEDRV